MVQPGLEPRSLGVLNERVIANALTDTNSVIISDFG
jgi:hypothetical protein